MVPSTHFVGPVNDREKYLLKVLVGKGAYGGVYEARGPNGKVAVKDLGHVDSHQQRKIFAEREVRNNHYLRTHHHITKIIESFRCHRSMYLVFEFVNGGTVEAKLRRLRKFSEKWARYYFQQIIFAVSYCHMWGIAWRDIKLDNMLLDCGEGGIEILKLCDMGFSKCEYIDSKCNTNVGTLAYMAPELNTGSPHVCDVPEYDGKAVDVYSCGVCLFKMLFGIEAIPEHKLNQSGTVILEDIPSSSYGHPISEGARALLVRLLDPEPTSRIKVDEILQDGWFKELLVSGFQEYNEQLYKAILRDHSHPEALSHMIPGHPRRSESDSASDVIHPNSPSLSSGAATELNTHPMQGCLGGVHAINTAKAWIKNLFQRKL